MRMQHGLALLLQKFREIPTIKPDLPGIVCYFLYEPRVTSWANILLERGNRQAKNHPRVVGNHLHDNLNREAAIM